MTMRLLEKFVILWHLHSSKLRLLFLYHRQIGIYRRAAATHHHFQQHTDAGIHGAHLYCGTLCYNLPAVDPHM